jgi:hypothetical protein|tara:strand:+ start:67 stop:1035 length:969 start_codon:yes stop_codon:yes gene_type:complete
MKKNRYRIPKTDLERLNQRNSGLSNGSVSNEQLAPAYLSPYNIKSLSELVHFSVHVRPAPINIDQVNPPDETVPWQFPYLREEEEKNFDKDPWQYTINQYGFRDVWKNKAKRPNIAFYGCSNTFGEGVESSKHWTTLVANHFRFNKFNFGIGGASALRIARTFVATQQVLNLNYAVILLPGLYRIDYARILSKEVSAKNRQWESGNIGMIPDFKPSHLTDAKLWKSLYSTFDDNMFIMNLIYAVSMITESAKANNVKIVFSSWCTETLYTLDKINAPNVYPNIGLKGIDVARDELHPGPESSKLFAEKLADWMTQPGQKLFL